MFHVYVCAAVLLAFSKELQVMMRALREGGREAARVMTGHE